MIISMKVAMKIRAAILFCAVAFSACDTDIEPEVVQGLYEYDEQYYENLRAYKKSDHTLFFCWYPGWTRTEGGGDIPNPASWGERIIGLPDSVDIVDLWMGIPSPDPNDTEHAYAPLAWEDMQFCRRVKGTRFVSHIDACWISKFTYQGKEWDLTTDGDEAIEAFADKHVADVYKYQIDGVDLDHEPNAWWRANFSKVMHAFAKRIGPKSPHPEILLMHNGYSCFTDRTVGELVDYFISQAYNCYGASDLQRRYDGDQDYVPTSKFIVTENLGDNHENAGVPFTEADGNTITSDFWCEPVGKGSRMYSLEGMARWNPKQGKKAGFGGFYVNRDYYSKTGIPYYNLRRTILIANPPVHK